ncbi:hypothetical protein [Halosimplex halophilum]|uniref:hypothetical protein n=1 Tax=Halosimplex halophilum TaxID=2559572 RepID=UPI00107FCE27|nr:hypothetical protein [Halosimplex halophilum]
MTVHTLAETQTAGFGSANGKVVETLTLEFDEARPAITVRHKRTDHPDPTVDRDVRTTTVETVTVVPTDDIDRRKVEIGTRHGRDRVIVETHDHAPRAYVRHERQDGSWTERAAWELHPATGISQVTGEAVADGGTVEDGIERLVEELYLSAYVNHQELDDVDPGYEYAVQQLLSDFRARNPGLLTKDMETAAMNRAQDRIEDRSARTGGER